MYKETIYNLKQWNISFHVKLEMTKYFLYNRLFIKSQHGKKKHFMNQQLNSSDKIFNLSVHSDFTVLIPWWYNYFLDKKNTNILIPLEQYYKFQCNHKLIFSTETTSIHRGQVFSVTLNNIWKWWIYFYRKKYIIELFSHLQEFSFIIWIILCCSYHYKLAVGIYICFIWLKQHITWKSYEEEI